jgi:hypothetical protein
MVDKTPRDMTDLLSRIQSEWTALMAAVDKLTPEQMVTPDAGGWSPKDNLAHVQAWEQGMLNNYLRGKPFHLAMGLDKAHADSLDETGINEILFERNKDRSSQDVIAGANQTHATMVKELGSMAFERLMQPAFPDDPDRRPRILWVIGNTYDHYEEHRRIIETITS